MNQPKDFYLLMLGLTTLIIILQTRVLTLRSTRLSKRSVRMVAFTLILQLMTFGIYLHLWLHHGGG